MIINLLQVFITENIIIWIADDYEVSVKYLIGKHINRMIVTLLIQRTMNER
jgi:hypothetical protein